MNKDEVLMCLSDTRSFGIEFEGFAEDIDAIRLIATNNGFSYSGDSSIEPDLADQGGIEVQTSVLSGKSGGETVYQFLEDAVEAGLLVNRSCGTHVHLGASEFFNAKKEIELTDINKLTGETVVIERSFYNAMLRNCGEERANYTIYSSEEMDFGSIKNVGFNDGRTSAYYKLPAYVNGIKVSLLIRSSTLHTKQIDPAEVVAGNYKLVLGGKSQTKEGVYVFAAASVFLLNKNGRNERFLRLRSTLATYYILEKLFMAMLPEERVENDFCKPLSKTIDYDSIMNCRSQEDIEKLWYKCTSNDTVAELKREHYHRSRYHSLNVHSLFYKYGTFEIRSHEGTLDAGDILMWTAMHQAIVDSIANEPYMCDRLPYGYTRGRGAGIPELLELLKVMVRKHIGDEKMFVITKYIINKIKENHPKLCAELQ